jgi:demethylmenaquinone methyltransferase / 2-methoxy-6-polyprenyl-1,4-benzoquinol methylase
MENKFHAGTGAMFNEIANRYDTLNRILSFGMDDWWRTQLVKSLGTRKPPKQVLDLATGTGDVAIRIAKTYPACRIIGLDPSERMIEVAKEKVASENLSERIHFSIGNAESLPYADRSFDGCCIAFGIRNVQNRLKGLQEMARVTRTGGMTSVLELGEPKVGILGPVVRFHIRSVVPYVGALLSGKKEYRYLQESVSAFPSPEDFMELTRQAGLFVLEHKSYTFGAANVFTGTPKAPR